MSSVPAARPVRGVILDFHHTLAHAGDSGAWVRLAWASLGRDGDPEEVFGAEVWAAALAYLDQLWEHARVIDPGNDRDLDPGRHRTVFDTVVADAPGIDAELGTELYAVMAEQWDVYTDTLPVLEALRDKGIRIVVLSNVGFDLTPAFTRTGIAPFMDGSVLSSAVGVVKPDPEIFRRALDVLGLPAEDVLMVGDAWKDDAAGASLGIRTLILPRTDDPAHGLELVLRLV